MADLGKRYTSIDIVRGVTAIVVVVAHLAAYLPVQDGSLSPADLLSRAVEFLFSRPMGNHPGVLAFIVLSGFCIHLPVARTSSGTEDGGFWRVFFLRRLIRLAPTYWLATAAGVVVLVVASSSPGLQSAPLQYGEAPWIALAARTTFLEAWHRFPGQDLGNGPLRTVATEMWLYALYPAVLFVHRRNTRYGMALFGVACLAISAVAAMLHIPDGGAFSSSESVPRFMVFWTLGALAAEYFVRHRCPELTRRGLSAAAVLFATNFALNHFLSIRGTWLIAQPVFGAAIAALLVATVNSDSYRTRPPHAVTTALSRAGEASYSLYAFHFPVIYAVVAAGGALGLSRGASAQVWQLVGLAATVLVTAVAYSLAERPAHRAAHALGKVMTSRNVRAAPIG